VTLTDRIQSELRTAMKAGDRPRVDAIRLLMSSLQKAEKDRPAGEFGDTALLTGILTSKDLKDPKQSDINATTVVFVKADGKWKVASAQWTPKGPQPEK